MKVLVIGGAGFLGRAVVSHFCETGWSVCGLCRNTSFPLRALNVVWHQMELPDTGLVNLLRNQQPDLVVHAAGTASVGQSILDPYHDFQQSVAVWMHVLDSIRRSKIHARVMLLSSAAVYGNPLRLPIVETDQLAPLSPYGYHKQICEEIAEYFVRLYDLAICSVRIFSAYGDGLKRQVLWDICQQALRHKQIELMGTGEESRDFVHVTDVARALALLAEHGDYRAAKYNLASGASTPIRAVASQLVRALGTDNPIRFTGQQRSGDPLYWQADISRLAALGFVPQVALEDGLRAYARWVLNG